MPIAISRHGNVDRQPESGRGGVQQVGSIAVILLPGRFGDKRVDLHHPAYAGRSPGTWNSPCLPANVPTRRVGLLHGLQVSIQVGQVGWLQVLQQTAGH